MVTDVIIIGGGAAGLCAAVYIKQKAPQLSVRIMEACPRVAKKLALTGNGRCNITNKNINLSRYHGENVSFCEYALQKYAYPKTSDFFESIGVPIVFEGDKGYPASLQANSVVDALRFTADNLGVITHLETKVSNIQVSSDGYKLISGSMTFYCQNLIIATGLLSGGDRLGCDGSMLELLKKAGFPIVKPTPAIVQIKTHTDIVRQLKGIKVNAKATLKIDGNTVRSEFGEVLFCDYGLSGPPILQISREVSRTDKKRVISLDLCPDDAFDTLYYKLANRAKNLSYRNLDEFFTGLLHKRLGQIILKIAGCDINDSVSTLDNVRLKKITAILKSFNFEVFGTTGFANSQVTAGGLNVTGFYNTTMMSKAYKNLYAIGEILDIDGDCGGFNLQWAWSSAMCAADSIIREKGL